MLAVNWPRTATSAAKFALLDTVRPDSSVVGCNTVKVPANAPSLARKLQAVDSGPATKSASSKVLAEDTTSEPATDALEATDSDDCSTAASPTVKVPCMTEFEATERLDCSAVACATVRPPATDSKLPTDAAPLTVALSACRTPCTVTSAAKTASESTVSSPVR